MMKTLIVFALMALAAADDHYVLEKINISDPASNLETMKSFMKCLLDKGSCNEVQQSYKVLVPESVREACGKCTIEQKQFAYKFFELLKSNFVEDYVSFKQMYDPENKYFDILESELNKYKSV